MTDKSAPGRPLLGVVLVALAVLCFAISDVVTKYLTQSYPVPLVAAGRYVSGAVLLLVILGPRIKGQLWQTNRTGLVLVRAMVLAGATLTLGFALRLMPVGETVAIVYLSPIAVLALAGPILGEKVPSLGWVAGGMGFVGVLLILRPGGGLDPVGVIWTLVNVGFATAYHLMSRSLSRTETPIAMLFYVTVLGAVLFTMMSLTDLPSEMPKPFDIAAFVMLGVLATLGHFLLTAAYREAPAPTLAPVNYFHLAWAALLGWLVFGHLPGLVTALGMVLVVVAGAVMAMIAGRASRKAEPPSPAPEL